MRLFKMMAVAAMVATGATAASAASLIVNSDFNGGATGFTSDLGLNSNITSPGRYAITTNPIFNHFVAVSYGDHTTGSGNMMAVNGANSPGAVFWRQTVSVAAGTDYVFSMFTSIWAGGQSTLNLVINGAMVGATITPSAQGIWVESTFVPWSSGAATSATIELSESAVGSGFDFAVDDLSFVATSVPIPAALPLMLAGLGALAFAGRKRAA